MANGLDSVRQQLNQFWNSMDKKNKRNVIFISALILLVAILLTIILGRTEYVVLYSGLDEKETAEIYSRLTEMGVNAKLEGRNSILVPKQNEPELRMQLTMENYPRSGFNYDMFLSNNSFGMTESEKRVLMTFQLQQNLAESIKSLTGVDDAVVFIGMPESDAFVLRDDKVPVTASVIIRPMPGYQITSNQAINIEKLIAKSVPGLSEDNITIIDTNMNVLNDNSNFDEMLVSNQFDLTTQLEDRIKNQVLGLLEPVFGYRMVVATVNAKLNFDRKVTESIRFEPVVDDEGIVRSQEILRERVRNNQEGGVVGEFENTTQYPEVQGGEAGSYDKNHQITNYEINEIKEIIEEQQGKLEELSISVIINDELIDESTIEQIQTLVATAIGTDETMVTVQNMKFDTSIQDELLRAFDDRNTARSIWLNTSTWISLALVISFLVIIFLIIKSNKNALVGKTAEELAVTIDTDSEVDIQPIDLEASDKNKTKQQLDKFAAQRPDAVAQLLKTWLSED